MKGLMILSLIFLSSCLSTKTNEQNTIQVTAHGLVNLAPDHIQVQFSVDTRDQDAQIAQAQNNAISSKLLSILKDTYALEPSDLKTTHFRVGPRYRHYQNERRLEGFEVNNGFVIILKEINKAGDLLNTLTNAGVGQISNLQFGNLNTQNAKLEAMELAVEEARQKAQVLAKAAGRSLGAVLKIHEVTTHSGGMQPRFEAMAAARLDSSPVPVEAGELAIRADVQVLFELY
jgi:uncharacterized protein